MKGGGGTFLEKFVHRDKVETLESKMTNIIEFS